LEPQNLLLDAINNVPPVGDIIPQRLISLTTLAMLCITLVGCNISFGDPMRSTTYLITAPDNHSPCTPQLANQYIFSQLEIGSNGLYVQGSVIFPGNRSIPECPRGFSGIILPYKPSP
jgi:hypothetical protein